MEDESPPFKEKYPVSSNEVSNLASDGGWLLRFFDSAFFCEWIAVTYLYRHEQGGVRDYLCNRMYTLPVSGIEEYLFQLCHLTVHKPSPSLEKYLIDSCSKSLRVCLKVYWFLQAQVEDYEEEDVMEIQEKCLAASVDAKWPSLICPRPPTFELSGTSRVLRMMSTASKRLLPLVGPVSGGSTNQSSYERERDEPNKPSGDLSSESGSESVAVADLESSLNMLKKSEPGTKVQQMTDTLMKKFRELASREGGSVKLSQLVDVAKEISAGNAKLAEQILKYFKKVSREGSTQMQDMESNPHVHENGDNASDAGSIAGEEAENDSMKEGHEKSLKDKLLMLVRKDKHHKGGPSGELSADSASESWSSKLFRGRSTESNHEAKTEAEGKQDPDSKADTEGKLGNQESENKDGNDGKGERREGKDEKQAAEELEGKECTKGSEGNEPSAGSAEVVVAVPDSSDSNAIVAENSETGSGQHVDGAKGPWGLGAFKVMRERLETQPAGDRKFLGKFLNRRSEMENEKEKSSGEGESSVLHIDGETVVFSGTPQPEVAPVTTEQGKDVRSSSAMEGSFLNKLRSSIPFTSVQTTPEGNEGKVVIEKKEAAEEVQVSLEDGNKEDVGKKEDAQSNTASLLRKLPFFKMPSKDPVPAQAVLESAEFPAKLEISPEDASQDQAPKSAKESLSSALFGPPSPARFFRKLIKEDSTSETETHAQKEPALETGLAVELEPASPSAVLSEMLKGSPGGKASTPGRFSALVHSWRGAAGKKLSPDVGSLVNIEAIEPLSLDPVSPTGKNQTKVFQWSEGVASSGAAVGTWGRQISSKVASGLKQTVSNFPSFKGTSAGSKAGCEEPVKQQDGEEGKVSAKGEEDAVGEEEERGIDGDALGAVEAAGLQEPEGVEPSGDVDPVTKSSMPRYPSFVIRKGVFLASLDFINALSDISRGLINVFPTPHRQKALQESLSELNAHLDTLVPPDGVCLPLGKSLYRVVHVVEEDALLLNSRERVPFMIFLEVLQCDPIKERAERDKSAASAQSLRNRGKGGIPLASGHAQLPRPPPWALHMWRPSHGRRLSHRLAVGQGTDHGREGTSNVVEVGLHVRSNGPRSAKKLAVRSRSPWANPTTQRGFRVSEWLLQSRLMQGNGSTESLDKLGTGSGFGREWEEGREEDSMSDTTSVSAMSDAFSATEGSEWEGHGPAEDGGVWITVRIVAVPGVTMDDVADMAEGKGRLNQGNLVGLGPRHEVVEPASPSTASSTPKAASATATATATPVAAGTVAGTVAASGAGSGSGSGSMEAKVKTSFGIELWEERRQRIHKTSKFASSPDWELKSLIVKSGDDCRQEHLAVQLVGHLQDIFEEAGLPLWLRPYEVIVTSSNSALIETIPNAVSLHNLKQRNPHLPSLKDFFVAWYGAGSSAYRSAQEKFVQSLAGYSILCYLLQVKDRHNGNILLDTEGHLIHIDFGFMLSNSPGGVNFENAPFKLTRDFLELMDSNVEGAPSEAFDYFKVLCIQGFLTARKHAERIILMVDMMQNSGCKCFKVGRKTTNNLRRRFHLTLTEEQCVSRVLALIAESMDAWRTRQYDYYQKLLNGILC